jgi:hypothetical protein
MRVTFVIVILWVISWFIMWVIRPDDLPKCLRFGKGRGLTQMQFTIIMNVKRRGWAKQWRQTLEKEK